MFLQSSSLPFGSLFSLFGLIAHGEFAAQPSMSSVLPQLQSNSRGAETLRKPYTSDSTRAGESDNSLDSTAPTEAAASPGSPPEDRIFPGIVHERVQRDSTNNSNDC